MTVRRRRRPGDLPLPRRRAAQHPGLRRALPGHARIVLGPQLPLARRDPRPPPSRCIAHNEQRAPQGADRDARRRRPTRTRGVRQRPRRGRAGSPALIADALAAGTAPGRDPRARAHRLRHRPDPGARWPRAGIPHRVLGSLGLYERAEVRDALAYLALLANPRRRAGLPPRRPGAAPRRRHRHRSAASSRTRARALRRRPDHRQRPRARARRRSARRRRATRLARFGAGLDARPRASTGAGRSLGHVVVATRDARRRPRRPPRRRAATSSPQPERAPRRRTRARGPALAVPRRPGLRRPASATGRLDHRLPRARRRPARRGDPARRRTAASPSPRSTAPRAPRRSSSCCSAARSSCCPPGARCRAPTPSDLEEERRLFYVAATRAKDQLVLTPLPRPRRTRHRRPVALPRRSRARPITPARARRLTTTLQRSSTMTNPDSATATGPGPAARAHPRAGGRRCCAGRSRPARSAFAP